MKIEHTAIWAEDLEKSKTFFETYFGAKAGKKYVNPKTSFESYFLSFDEGGRLEIMHMPQIPEDKNDVHAQSTGLIHIALSVGDRDMVDDLTKRLETDGYEILSRPRETGDGYYESCVQGPDRIRVEITG